MSLTVRHFSGRWCSHLFSSHLTNFLWMTGMSVCLVALLKEKPPPGHGGKKMLHTRRQKDRRTHVRKEERRVCLHICLREEKQDGGNLLENGMKDVSACSVPGGERRNHSLHFCLREKILQDYIYIYIYTHIKKNMPCHAALPDLFPLLHPHHWDLCTFSGSECSYSVPSVFSSFFPITSF